MSESNQGSSSSSSQQRSIKIVTSCSGMPYAVFSAAITVDLWPEHTSLQTAVEFFGRRMCLVLLWWEKHAQNQEIWFQRDAVVPLSCEYYCSTCLRSNHSAKPCTGNEHVRRNVSVPIQWLQRVVAVTRSVTERMGLGIDFYSLQSVQKWLWLMFE